MVRLCCCVWLACLLVACGGGGGGSASPGTTPPPTSGGVPEPESPAVPDSPAPLPSNATIVFPALPSSTTASTVTVRGFVTPSLPPGGRIIVGGVVASPVVAAATTAGLPRLGNEVQVASTEDRTMFVASVPLKGGRNRLPIHVEDDDGNASEDLAEVVLENEGVPMEFHFDPVARQIVGLEPNIDSLADGRVLIEYDLVTRSFELHRVGSMNDYANSGSCYRSARREFIYLRPLPESGYELISYDLDTRLSEVLIAFDFDPGEDYGGPSGPIDLACGPDADDVYMLMNYFPGTYENRRSVILRLDPSAGTVTIHTETNLDAHPVWQAFSMAWSPDGLITMEDFSPISPLTRVDFLNGSRSDFTPGLNVGGVGLVAALPKVYVNAVQGPLEIDVSDPDSPTQRAVLSVPEDDELYPIIYSQFAYDSVANTLIIADRGYEAMLEVDIATGKPRILLQHTLGTGPGLSGPGYLALSPELDELFVLDKRRRMRLIQVELPAGDRRVLANFPNPFNEDGRGLAFDPENRRVYVASFMRILVVDVDTGAVDTLASSQTPAGSGFPFGGVSALRFDAQSSRLLYLDAEGQALVAIDPANGLRSVISRAGQRGEGPPLANPTDVVIDTRRNAYYVANQLTANLMRIDPETGDRTIVLSTCPDPIGPDETLGGLTYHPTEDALRIYSDKRFRYDLETGVCQTVDERGPLWIESESGQIFAAGKGGIGQVDRETGEFVLISR